MKSNLFEIMKEHPELPVIPMVDPDVVGAPDDYSWWWGSLGHAYLGELAVWEKPGDEMYGGEEIFFRDREDAEETIADFLYDDIDDEDMLQKTVAEEIGKLKWKEVIYVNVLAFDEKEL